MEALDNLTLILILILKKEQWNNCHMTKRTNHPRPRRASLFLSSKLGLNLHQFLHHHRHQNLFRASLSNNGERQTAVGRQSRIKVKIRINLKIGNFKHFLRRISILPPTRSPGSRHSPGGVRKVHFSSFFLSLFQQNIIPIHLGMWIRSVVQI